MLAALVHAASSSSTALVTGLVFGLLAMGIVLVYRSTRVINFAVGNMGLVGAGCFALLVVAVRRAVLARRRRRRSPSGTLFGAIIELIVIRRLFDAPRVIVLVATIGIAQLSLGDPHRATRRSTLPAPRSRRRSAPLDDVAGVRVTGAAARRSSSSSRSSRSASGGSSTARTLGKAVKASAENPDLARSHGISPKAGLDRSCGRSPVALATLSHDRCSAGQTRLGARTSTTLGPSTLVRALAAAVIAGMVSFPRAFVAGIAIGVVAGGRSASTSSTSPA